jgi:TetR/AcrR family transcriptional regulator, mexJK operon transcriptional repressor
MIAETSAPLGRREQRKTERRQAIVAAARRCFLSEGYAATSMSGLLKTLGGSKATLWNYFHSKEELFAAVIEDIVRDFSQQMAGDLKAGANLRTSLETFCRVFMVTTGQPDGVAAWRLIIGESQRFPELGHIFYEMAAQPVEHALAAYIQDQIQSGRLVDEGPLKMARVLLGLCSTQHNLRLWGVPPPDDENIDADAQRFANYFLSLFAVDQRTELT